MKELRVATAILVVAAATASAATKDLTISAEDGFPLKATLHSAGRSGPGVLLLHQCNDGESFIKTAAKLPDFGAASEEDTNAAAAIKWIVGLSPNTDSQLTIFKNAGHAASMFAKQPDLEPEIVIWFRRNLPVAGYGTPTR
jgi:hypothetical protein